MKRRILLLVAFVFALGFSLSVQAQNPNAVENQYPGDEKAKAAYEDALHSSLDPTTTGVRTTWLANRPGDNWFISVGAGASMLLSEENRKMDFGDQISAPSFQFSLGKWFSPVWGLRLNATYGELNSFVTWDKNSNVGSAASWYVGDNYTLGGSAYQFANATHGPEIYKRFLSEGEYMTLEDGRSGYQYQVPYAGASFDFLLNLKNLFTTYNPKAFFNPVLYAGLGYAHTFGDKDEKRTAINNMMIKGGLQLNFRLHDRWDFFIDAQGLMLPENFDWRTGDDQTMDGVFNLTGGFTYRFNLRHFIKAPLYDQNEIDALNAEINRLRNRPEVVCPPPVECPKCPDPVVVEKETELTPVFFTLDSYVVRDNQWLSLAKAAEYLLENPNSKLRIAAYADKNTGNPRYNMKLSEKRANAVAKVLGDKFGVEKSRLILEHYGDTVQPFAENDWNRVAIFIVP